MAATFARFEWLLIEALVLGVLIWQWVSIRRAVKRDREQATRDRQPPTAL